MKKIFAFFAAYLLPFAICLLPAELFAEQVKVVVSIHPLYDITKQIGKDKVKVKTLLPPAASPHTFEPTPKDMMELSDAKAFIKIGAGLEFWAERVVKAAANKNLAVIDLSNGMPLIYGIDKHYHNNGHDHGHKHKRDAADPHFWLDPILAKKIVDRITETMAELDPSNSSYYKANAEAYKKELDKLHSEIARRVNGFTTKEYVTFHSAWNYFSKRYGLTIVGVIEEAPGREPAPKDISRIVKELKKIRAKAVFAEPQFNPKIAEAVAQEAGAKVLFLDPIGASNAPDRDTYIKLMLYNISRMERALK